MSGLLRSLLGSVLIVALFVLVLWAASEVFRFELALWPTLLGSLLLTVLLNLVLSGTRRMTRRRPQRV